MSQRRKLTQEEENILFDECEGLCPLCGKSLINNKKGRQIKVYEKAHIYPHRPTDLQRKNLQNIPIPDDIESPANIILLCRSCHKIQDDQTSREDYLKLYDKKQQQSRRYNAKIAISELDIEPELDKVIDGFKNIDKSEIIKLDYRPVSVDKKVKDILLCDKIVGYVVQYYSYIKEKLQQLDEKKSGCSDLIATDIKKCFLREKSLQLFLSQEEIYDAIVEWLISKTNGKRIACEIMVSFFVQECEVFDAPT